MEQLCSALGLEALQALCGVLEDAAASSEDKQVAVQQHMRTVEVSLGVLWGGGWEEEVGGPGRERTGCCVSGEAGGVSQQKCYWRSAMAVR